MTSTQKVTGMPISVEPDGRETTPATTLAVVIPTLNEEKALPGLLASLHRQSKAAERIIVADGGSIDGTVFEARRGGAEVAMVAACGRGGQIVAALAQVTEEVVLIAHADMLLPTQALESVRRALGRLPHCPGGCLGHRFDGSSLALRVIEWWDEKRARFWSSYGDQAQFFRRELLRSVGGFPDQPIMEDLELSLRLRSLGKPIYLDFPVTASARRFVRMKWWRAVWQNLMLRRCYRRRGLAACADLHARYYRAQ
jgi:glycosyltransferase involved in cell wall biosynthesis